MAYYINTYRVFTHPRAAGLYRFVKLPLGIGISITGGLITEHWEMTEADVSAADAYYQGGITHEVDETTYDLVHAYQEEWAWSE